MPSTASVTSVLSVVSTVKETPVKKTFAWRSPLEGHYFIEVTGTKAEVVVVEQLPHGTRPVLAYREVVNPPANVMVPINLKACTQEAYRSSLIYATKRKYQRCLSWALAVAEAHEAREDAATALQGCYDAKIVAKIYGFQEVLDQCHREQLKQALDAA